MRKQEGARGRDERRQLPEVSTDVFTLRKDEDDRPNLRTADENGPTHSRPTSRADNENEIDPDLRRVLDAWPTLPEALRAGI